MVRGSFLTLNHQMPQNICNRPGCGLPAPSRCTRCLRAHYCSIEHQKDDHRRHRVFCCTFCCCWSCCYRVWTHNVSSSALVNETQKSCSICANMNDLLANDPDCRALKVTVIHATEVGPVKLIKHGIPSDIALFFVVHRNAIPTALQPSVSSVFREQPMSNFVVTSFSGNKAIAFPSRDFPDELWSSLPRPFKTFSTRSLECSVCLEGNVRSRRVGCGKCGISTCLSCVASVILSAGTTQCTIDIISRGLKSVPWRCPVCRANEAIDLHAFTHRPKNTVAEVLTSLKLLAGTSR